MALAFHPLVLVQFMQWCLRSLLDHPRFFFIWMRNQFQYGIYRQLNCLFKNCLWNLIDLYGLISMFVLKSLRSYGDWGVPPIVWCHAQLTLSSKFCGVVCVQLYVSVSVCGVRIVQRCWFHSRFVVSFEHRWLSL